VNLLIDESLTPSMVQLLAARGVAAVHVAHIGMPGATDPEVWRYAFEHDQIVVTINAADFLRLAESADPHPGLIVPRIAGGL
jgi:predicted nuclease of predicted toxin-antitoxin system